METDSEKFFRLMRLTASVWFYGEWKAETSNEIHMQEILESEGFWPINSEEELFTKLGIEP